MYKFPESVLKGLRENRLETLDMGAMGFKGLATLSGHKYGVSSLIVLPDGRLASGSNDCTIRLWNVSSGRCEATLSSHESFLTSLTVLPDGRLASGSLGNIESKPFDKTIRLWNVSSGRSLLSYLSGRCEATLSCYYVDSLTVLPDGRLVSGSANGTIRLWNVSSGRCEATLSGHEKGVTSLTVLPDGRLASGSNDKTIRLWDVSSGSCEATLSGHTNCVSSLTVLPDGRLASGSDDKTIRLWNVSSGICEVTLSGHESNVDSLTVLPDGRLASGSQDKTIRLWNVSSGRCEATLSDHESAVHSLTVLPDGRLASGGGIEKSGDAPGVINLWPMAPGRLLYLSLAEALSGNNTLKNIIWSGTESLFNDEQHAWLKALLARNQASKIAPSTLPTSPKEPEKAAGGAGAEALPSHDDIAKLIAQLAEEKSKREALEEKLKVAELAPKAPGFSIIPFSNIKFTEPEQVLGEGGFGLVRKANWQYIDVAVKQLKTFCLSEGSLKEFESEAERHGALRHPNVVSLYGVSTEPGKYCMVMELMLGGSLYQLLHNGKDLPWSLRLSIAKDIAVGLSFLHEQKIVHRDLKSLNVLLDDRLRAKLCDFGLSKVKSESASTTGTAASVGTLGWMAPELFALRPKYTETSDIYALGMVFWELSSREAPYPGAEKAVVMELVKSGEREEIPDETPPKIASLIRQCWATKPEDRPKSVKVVLDELLEEAVIGGGASVSASGKAAEKSVADSGYLMFSHP